MAAATAPEGDVVVKAGAGTGKTRTLIARVGHLVGTLGVPPEEIVAVTFTNKAAREIRERVGATLGRSVAFRLVLGTFHSVSMRIMKRHLHLVGGLNARFGVADDADSARIAALAALAVRAVRLTGKQEEDDRSAETMGKEAAKVIRTWKAWGLTSEMAEETGRARRTDSEEKFARIYASYQDDLRRRNMVDFGDLILNVVSLFERYPDVLASESSRVRHLLVDEAQDANPAQVKWVRLLSSVHGNVTSIGDEDQSIFSFQAGFPEAIDKVAGGSAMTYSLTVNRRCTDEILTPAVALVGWNKRSSPKSLSSGRSGEKVALHLLASEREEAATVAASVKARIKAGTSPDDVAILVRSAWPMAAYEDALIKANVPYRLVGGFSLTEREEVKDMMAFVRLAIQPNDENAFERIYNKPSRGLGSAALMAIKSVSRATRTMHEACNVVRNAPKERAAEQWNEGLRELADVLATLDQQAYDPNCRTAALLATVLHERGGRYLAYVKSGAEDRTFKRRMQSLTALLELAEEETSPDEFLRRIALCTDADPESQPKGPPKPKVRLSTIHSSKGLEWDHVYLPSFVDLVIPSPRALEAVPCGDWTDPWNGPCEGGEEEERRLAHVAFTRAKQTLTISAYLGRAVPSRFLPEAGLDAILSLGAFEMGARKGRGRAPVERAGRKGFGRRQP